MEVSLISLAYRVWITKSLFGRLTKTPDLLCPSSRRSEGFPRRWKFPSALLIRGSRLRFPCLQISPFCLLIGNFVSSNFLDFFVTQTEKFDIRDTCVFLNFKAVIEWIPRSCGSQSTLGTASILFITRSSIRLGLHGWSCALLVILHVWQLEYFYFSGANIASFECVRLELISLVSQGISTISALGLNPTIRERESTFSHSHTRSTVIWK